MANASINEHSRESHWRVRVPATTANLGPGFDCFGLALRRYLTLDVERLDAPGVEITLSGQGADSLPRDENNLVYRSFLWGGAGKTQSLPGVRMHVNNEIPLARGQGSSAAATVAGLAAQHLLRTGVIDTDALINLGTAMEGHPDNVAPAIMGGLVLSRQESDGTFAVRPIPTANELQFILAVPDFTLNTSDARKVLPFDVQHADAVFNVRAAAWMAASWVAGDWESVGEAMDDRLHQPYRARLIPGFHEVCHAAREAGGLGACLSGAGPTIIAITLADPESIGQAMRDAWLRHGITSEYVVTTVDTEGLIVKRR